MRCGDATWHLRAVLHLVAVVYRVRTEPGLNREQSGISMRAFRFASNAQLVWCVNARLLGALIVVAALLWTSIATAREWWVAGESAVLFAFNLLALYLVGPHVIRRVRVWSVLEIDDGFVTQRLSGMEHRIDARREFRASHRYPFAGPVDAVRPSRSHWLELHQDGHCVAFSPRELGPRMRVEDVPERMRAAVAKTLPKGVATERPTRLLARLYQWITAENEVTEVPNCWLVLFLGAGCATLGTLILYDAFEAIRGGKGWCDAYYVTGRFGGSVERGVATTLILGGGALSLGVFGLRFHRGPVSVAPRAERRGPIRQAQVAEMNVTYPPQTCRGCDCPHIRRLPSVMALLLF